MFEIELKTWIDEKDAGEILKKLDDMGAVYKGSEKQADIYFNAPDRDFAKTDEALRLRKIDSKFFLTYKGPKDSADIKARWEIEIPVDPGISKILQQLRYNEAESVEKTREKYKLNYEGMDVVVCIDRVLELGIFMEIETQAASNEKQGDVILSLGEILLGAKPVVIRESYLELLMKKKRE